MFSLFKIMLTIIYITTVTLFECRQNVPNTAFELINQGRPSFKTHTLLNYCLDKVLCRMRRSLIFATLNEISITFEKENFINAKKVLNFIQSLQMKRK